MAKFPTFPTLYDEALQIHLSKLKGWGYLKPRQIKSGSITWSVRDDKIGSISITVNTISEHPYIELNYKYGDNPRNYKVYLVSIPSNLGIGRIWYFECPNTRKRCRKLYSINGYFLHREAFRGCMYESQTQSKYYRYLMNTLGVSFKMEKLYKKLYGKYFKTHYNEKPTKRYLRIMNEINKLEDKVKVMKEY